MSDAFDRALLLVNPYYEMPKSNIDDLYNVEVGIKDMTYKMTHKEATKEELEQLSNENPYYVYNDNIKMAGKKIIAGDKTIAKLDKIYGCKIIYILDQKDMPSNLKTKGECCMTYYYWEDIPKFQLNKILVCSKQQFRCVYDLLQMAK